MPIPIDTEDDESSEHHKTFTTFMSIFSMHRRLTLRMTRALSIHKTFITFMWTFSMHRLMMTILMSLLVLPLPMGLCSHCFWMVSLSTMMLVLYSSVAFTWLLCIWYLWRTILTSGLWGIGLTAGVSSCCCLETLIYR